MSDQSDRPEAQDAAARPLRLPRSRWQAVYHRVIASVLLLTIALSGVSLLLMNRAVTAPDWLRARIEARLSAGAPDLQFAFGEMSVAVYQGWRPQNYGGGYSGSVTLQTAFAKSINTVAIRVLHDVGYVPLENLVGCRRT